MLDNFDQTKELPVGMKTMAASAAAALFRIVLMPVDTLKTSMQVGGKVVAVKGPPVFWYGALAASSATFVGHYPWFLTYNFLNEHLPRYEDKLQTLGRSALIGFCASAVSDTCSNSIRVVKVYKQANEEAITYPQALKRVLAEDGVMGLLGRGLKTKILANGMQGLMFSVLWKYIDDLWFKAKK
ncbi:PET8 [Symbiodinium microadriaticum]|nr:PET8 [Symbiodinium microadriaticum]